MKFLFAICCIIMLSGCNKRALLSPRPHQYPKLQFPSKSYTSFQFEDCPFKIDIPSYSKVEQKLYLFDDVPVGKCWFDIEIAHFDAKIHCSYYTINQNNKFDELVNDAFTMASKHNIRASFREEIQIENSYGSSGIIFNIQGPVASPYQFFLSDSTNHFLRGSLYFNNASRTDSLQPIVEFLYDDIQALASSLQWQGKVGD